MKAMIRNKRGISHVEVIMSFIIFFSIVAVVFIFLRPIREPSLNDVVLDIVEEGFMEDSLSAVVTIPFKIDDTIFANLSYTCFRVVHPLDIDDVDPDKLHLNNVFLKNSSREIIPFDLEPSSLEVAIEDPFYSLSYSFQEIFAPEALNRNDCALVPQDMVIFSTPRVDTVYSYNKLTEINDEYTRDYLGLKDSWFLPRGNDFSIKILDASGNTLFDMARGVPPRRDVFARDIDTQMLRGTETERIIINIRVWQK